MSEAGPGPEAVAAVADRLVARFSEIAATAMAGLPICNPALGVAALGFRAYAGRALGVVVTPWFLSLVAVDLPGGPATPPARTGSIVRLGLPAGEVEFIAGEVAGLGRVDACSLFSPMDAFAAMDAAVETARAAMAALFETQTPSAPPPPLDRRALLRGRFAAPEAAPA